MSNLTHVLSQVTEAKVEPCVDVMKTYPNIAGYLEPDSPGIFPRLRCVTICPDENPSSQMDYTRVSSWYISDLRERYYGLDKRHSRAAATLAIPLLLNHVNTLKGPQQAEWEFNVVFNPDAVHELLGMAGDVDEESLQPFLDLILWCRSVSAR